MNPYKILRPILFKINAETVHDAAINFLQFTPNLATLFAINKDYKNLHTSLWNLDFKAPIGMAAGFDKNARCYKTIAKFGFGFIEVGTVTPRPQSGNDKPRLFRLHEDEAIINRLGFNNLGVEVFAKNLSAKPKNFPVILGANIGKNKDTENALDDYPPLLEKLYEISDYMTINISSPNTKNLRDLQNEDQLDLFLSEILKKKIALKNLHKKDTPILLKLAPDLEVEQQEKIAAIILKNQIDGIIISNTTISRSNLKSSHAQENGGLSGKPLFDSSTQVLRNFYKFTNGKIPLIGVGGISNAADAYEKIKSGASLVQIYSAFVYQGYGLVEEIKNELSLMLEKDGFSSVAQAVGVYHN